MKKILVVDDNPVSRELVREALESAWYEIGEATHGQQALETIARIRPDLVLMDIQMPVLDGFAALKAIRADGSLAGIRIIAVTAFAMRGDRERALAAGFDGHFTKPIDSEELERQVRDLPQDEGGHAG